MNDTTPAPPPPDRVRKRIATLGHHLAAYAEALDALRARAGKGRLPERLAPHVGRLLDWLPCAAMPDAFQVALRLPGETPDHWQVMPGEAPPCAGAAARALLHLPGLQLLWAGWLRGSVLADLRARLGRAWLADPVPLPPHGAIAGLGIASWADWARLRGSGRVFELRFAGQAGALRLSADETESRWRETAEWLASSAPGAALIAELPAPGTKDEWRAEFARQGQRWEMRDLVTAAD